MKDSTTEKSKKSDVLVVSSLWEGFGNIIVEALSVKTQVVSTDCHSGPREILDKFNQQVPNGKKSKTITILIKQFLKEKSVGKNQSLQQGFSENHSAKKGVSNV